MDGQRPPKWLGPQNFTREHQRLADQVVKTIEKQVEIDQKKYEAGIEPTTKKLARELSHLRSDVDKILNDRKMEKAAEKALAPFKYFPLEAKEDLRRIISMGFAKRKSVNEIIRDVRHYFKFQFYGHSKSGE